MSDTTTSLKVSGWGCEGCSSATEDELKKVDGVRSVKSDLAAGTAEVVHDPKVSRADLVTAVTGAGYTVTD